MSIKWSFPNEYYGAGYYRQEEHIMYNGEKHKTAKKLIDEIEKNHDVIYAEREKEWYTYKKENYIWVKIDFIKQIVTDIYLTKSEYSIISGYGKLEEMLELRFKKDVVFNQFDDYVFVHNSGGCSYLSLRIGKNRFLADGNPDFRSFYLTKKANVGRSKNNEEPKEFLKFLSEISNNDIEIQKYLLKLMTSLIFRADGGREFYYIFGFGRNGKTTFVNLLRNLFGDYQALLEKKELISGMPLENNKEIFALSEKRFVVVNELGMDDVIRPDKIKLLTGNDELQVYTNSEFRKYRFKAKIFLVSNYLPNIKLDDGINDRMVIIPFTNRISQPNELLEKVLCDELDKIYTYLFENRQNILEYKEKPSKIVKIHDYLKIFRNQFSSYFYPRYEIGETGCSGILQNDLYNDFLKYFNKIVSEFQEMFNFESSNKISELGVEVLTINAFNKNISNLNGKLDSTNRNKKVWINLKSKSYENQIQTESLYENTMNKLLNVDMVTKKSMDNYANRLQVKLIKDLKMEYLRISGIENREIEYYIEMLRFISRLIIIIDSIYMENSNIISVLTILKFLFSIGYSDQVLFRMLKVIIFRGFFPQLGKVHKDTIESFYCDVHYRSVQHGEHERLLHLLGQSISFYLYNVLSRYNIFGDFVKSLDIEYGWFSDFRVDGLKISINEFFENPFDVITKVDLEVSKVHRYES